MEREREREKERERDRERGREILMNLLDNISKKNGFEILKGQLQGGQERGERGK